MEAAEQITRVESVISRADGSECRIVAEAMFGLGLERSIDLRVHRRDTPEDNWMLCDNKPAPNWRAMSVDDYEQRGRSEMLRVVSTGEIMKVLSLIGTVSG
jgi:hypothetical protein